MKTKVTIEQAYEIFATRIVSVCTARGARIASNGAQVLNTPVGGLRVSVSKNWITCHFASPTGGYLATRGGSDPGTGKWLHHCPREVETLTDIYYVDRFAAVLGVVFAFAPTAEQLKEIMLDQRDQHRHVKKMAAFFSMLPDMDEPEGEKPQRGYWHAGRWYLPGTKPADDKPKPKARKTVKPKAKDAKPKRHRKVSAR